MNGLNDLDHPSVRPSFPKWLIVLGLCCGGIAFFWARGDHVTATVAGAITFAGFSGYRIGAAKLAGFFCGLSAAYVVAPEGVRCWI